MGLLGGLLLTYVVSALSPLPMALSSSRVLAVSPWGRRGGQVIDKKPLSPRHEHEPSLCRVGLFHWSQSGTLGLARLQTSSFTCCTALGWAITEKDLRWGWTSGDGHKLHRGNSHQMLGKMLPPKGSKGLRQSQRRCGISIVRDAQPWTR